MAFMKQCDGVVFRGEKDCASPKVKVSYDEAMLGAHKHIDGEIELPPGHRLTLGGIYTVALDDGESLTVHVTSCQDNIAKFHGIR
jgi:hypothetical protein